MGKHSGQRISYWEARRRRRDLRKSASAKAKGPKRKGSGKLYWFAVFFAIGLAVGAAMGFYYKPIAKLAAKVYLAVKVKKSHVTGTEARKVAQVLHAVSTDPNKSVNTLIMGSDAGSNKGEGGYCRSDVMMLVCLQERDKRAVILSIPRDTMVQIPGYGTQKINAAHAFRGPSGAISAVQSLTGLEVNHFISMQFEGFKKIVNALGGVPIHLNSAISDPHAGYLPAGDLLLDGEQALVVVRSRKLPNGDVDRIKSQQAFLKALAAKAEQQKSVWKANQLVNIITENCKMDYTAGQLMDLATEVQGFSLDNVQYVTVPGDSKYIGGVSYFVADMPMLAQVANEINTNTQVSAELMAKLQAGETNRVEVLNAPNADVVSVLSGMKTSTWAVPTVAQELRLMGHQKVYEGTTKEPLAKTTIYYRKEVKDLCGAMLKAVPEFQGADVVQNDQIPAQYNSPMVVVLGTGFNTPSLTAIYGRIASPAFNFENFGRKVNSFS
jgi:polyisoprenyl-teichoic acid--peptidoglycan teichoic acid transferase